jgi:hypothetical protein
LPTIGDKETNSSHHHILTCYKKKDVDFSPLVWLYKNVKPIRIQGIDRDNRNGVVHSFVIYQKKL